MRKIGHLGVLLLVLTISSQVPVYAGEESDSGSDSTIDSVRQRLQKLKESAAERAKADPDQPVAETAPRARRPQRAIRRRAARPVPAASDHVASDHAVRAGGSVGVGTKAESAKPETPKAELPSVAESTARPAAEAGRPDKSGYNLFNPVPANQMREFVTDRPDRTESPYTVDAGHFQVETDIVNYTYRREIAVDSSTGDKTVTITRNYKFNAMNLKLGLANAVDFQAVVESFNSNRTESPSGQTKKEGVGDTTLRLKWNLIGNDGGDFAIGLMPFVKLPTNANHLANDKLEGGVILPFSISLPNDWGLGAMLQLNKSVNENNRNYHTAFISSLTIGHSIVGPLEGYAEIFSQATNETGKDWVSTFDVGLVYDVASDIKLDIGVNVGLTNGTDDLNPFLGLSYRR